MLSRVRGSPCVVGVGDVAATASVMIREDDTNVPTAGGASGTADKLLTLHSTLASSRVLVPPPPHPTPLPVPNFRSPTILLMGIPGSSRSR